ncbi:hypothetical protein BGX34_004019 [Mortierella sp. NVP85]|nr:hypothetical protein BGX34_004019 [Mortierella sp. NVP85]
MRASPPQAFRSRSSSKVISIPTRYDTRSKKDVVRWKDILLFFEDARIVMNGELPVLFLTDEDLEDLIPLRIAHHPDVVLQVVLKTDDQPDQSATVPSESDLSKIPEDMSGRHLFVGSSGNDTRTSTRDVMALRITEIDDSRALVVHSQSTPLESRVSLHTSSPSVTSVQGHLTSSADPSVDEGANRISLQMDSIMAQQEELRQLKEKVRQMQQRMDEVQQIMEHASQQAQDSPPSTNSQQQEAQAMQQEVLRQMNEVLQKIQLVDQRTHYFQQQLKQHIDSAQQRTQEMDQQKQQMDEILLKMQQLQQLEQLEQLGQLEHLRQLEQLEELERLHQLELSQERLLQHMDGAHQEIQQEAPKTLDSQSQPPLPISEEPQQEEHSMEGLPQVSQERDTEDHSQQSLPQAPETDQENQQQSQADNQSCSQDPFPSPQLFVVLPKAASTYDSLEGSHSPQFRLYFLCEADTHTKGTHEIHFMNHPGYDIINPDEFFEIYGPHLLSMMHMINPKAEAEELVVSPLMLSTITTKISADGKHVRRKHLIRHTIECLGRMAFSLNDDKKKAAPGPLELSRLKQYLKVEDGESVSGGLVPMAIQDGHYMWVCDEYQRKCHELTMKRLEELITTNGGKCSVEEGNIKIVIESCSLESQLRGQVVNLCETQATGTWKSLKTLNLKLGRGQWTGSTTDISINLININSIELEFPHFSTTIRISEGHFVDVTIQINRLFAITQDDLDFIQQCYPVQLSVMNTPEEEDEDRLVSILQHNPRLTELRIGCIVDRTFTIIDLVISTARKAREEGTNSALHTFKVMDEGLTAFDWDKAFDRYCHVASTVTFCMETTDFDMETDIMLQVGQTPSGTPAHKFIKRYGWSIRTLHVSGGFNNHLATLLDEATQKRGSKITHLDLNPPSLTVPGLDALDRTIKRSRVFAEIRLHLNSMDWERGRIYARILLQRYGQKLTSLNIYTSSPDGCIPALARAFPTRSSFPVLKRFVFNSGGCSVSNVCVQWIISMVSTPSQATVASLPSTTAPTPIEASATSLEFIDLSQICHHSVRWGLLILAIDFSALIELDLYGGYFAQGSIEYLADRIHEFDSKPLQLRRIRAHHLNRGLYRMAGALCTTLANRNPPISFIYE